MCSNSGLKAGIPCRVYFVSFTYGLDIYFKLGITQRDIPSRFQGDWSKFNMSVLWEIELPDYHVAKELEKYLLNKHSDIRFNTNLLRSGNTETFKEPIEFQKDWMVEIGNS